MNLSKIAEYLRKGKNNIVFTGAGISTESGIPDYRSKGGIWDKYKPIMFQEFMASRDARIEYWKRKHELYGDLKKAAPNNAHKALAALYSMGYVDAIITQNIDGLHQLAGIPDDAVIELHGSNRRVRCMSCGALSTLEEAHARIDNGDLAPGCQCGGYLKPDTISFGQNLDGTVLAKATSLSNKADFFMVIGSTLLVQPACLLPQYAKQNKAFLVLINLSPTQYDHIFDIKLTGKAGEILPQILAVVKE
jgi:NAD-dependent deacetylase